MNKRIFVALCIGTLTSFSQSQAASPKCQLKKSEDGARHYVCDVQGIEGQTKPVHFLYLPGSLAKNAYYHGKFLAREIEDGTIPAIVHKIKLTEMSLDPAKKDLLLRVKDCVFQKYKNSLPDDFFTMHENLAKGVRAGGGTQLTKESMIDASLAIEFSIYMDGLEKGFEQDNVGTLLELKKQCNINITPIILGDLFKGFGKSSRSVKTGCTGFAISQSHTKIGSLIHGRNFDHSLIGYFEKHPVVFYQAPDEGYHYASVAGAGVHYAAGVSGFNEAGLSISTHELQTTETAIQHPGKSGAQAPHLAETILNRAGNIDEAWTLAQQYGNFGAWTFLIADSKTQEMATIEFTGKKRVLTRRVKNGFLAQTNHFIDPEMKNRAFEFTYATHLETRARFAHVEKMIKRESGHIDEQFAINLLSSHWDHLVGRSVFGRTPTKTYTAMSHVMLPSKQIFYTTFGDTYPTSSGKFLGFRINFRQANTAQPFSIVDTKISTDDNRRWYPNWYASMKDYVFAYFAYRNYQLDEDAFANSYAHLTKAINKAEEDDISEFAYYFIRGRVALLAALRTEGTASSEYIESARDDFAFILEAIEQKYMLVHHYHEALTNLWLARTSDLLGEESNPYYKRAEILLKQQKRAGGSHSSLAATLKYFVTDDGYFLYDFDALSDEVKAEVDFIMIE